MKNTTGYKAINLLFAVFHAFTTAERKSAVGLGSICLAEYLPDNRLLQTAYILLQLGIAVINRSIRRSCGLSENMVIVCSPCCEIKKALRFLCNRRAIDSITYLG